MRAPDFWISNSFSARVCAAALSPLGAAYALTVRWKSLTRPYRAKARVVCVGNLTAGGSGKTPIAIAVANILSARGKCVFLSRGFGGRQSGPLVVNPKLHSGIDVGDEALLLARAATAIVSRDRAAGAELADSIGADFIIMDDGFQNFGLAKDLSLLVVDGETGFGNGKVIPAGPLRESVISGCSRSDAIVIVGRGDPKLPPFRGVILRARLVADSPEWMRGRRMVAFAGIGRPQKFFDMLRNYGADLAGAVSFGDHHQFTNSDIAQLRASAESAGAELVTTEKDLVRLPPEAARAITPIPVRAVFEENTDISKLLYDFARGPEAVAHGG